jgi:uncharacterized protein YecE (DUF72 family)
MQLLAGALLERPPGPKYKTVLGFAELAPPNPLPKPGTLAKWRQGLPEGFELGLRAPEVTWNTTDGPLRAGPALDDGLTWLSEASEALGASILVVATGAAVTTGARDRDRLRSYFGRLPRRSGLTIVWRPTGLWEPESVQSMSRSLGITGGFDAVDDPVPRGDIVYGTLRAEGLRRSFSHAQLLDVIDKLHACEATRAYVSVDSPQSFREARLLQTLYEGGE